MKCPLQVPKHPGAENQHYERESVKVRLCADVRLCVCLCGCVPVYVAVCPLIWLCAR